MFVKPMTMTYRLWKHPYYANTTSTLSSVWTWLCEVAHAAQEARNGRILSSIITWAGKGTSLFQPDPLVPVDSQLQAAAQLLVHQAALAVTGAIRHKAGQVSVARAVSTHHTLTGQEHHRRRTRRRMRATSGREDGYMNLQSLGDNLMLLIYSFGFIAFKVLSISYFNW